MLTSDHGATRVVEQTVAAGRAAVRLDADRLHEIIVAAARGAAGDGAWIADTREQLVYLTPAGRALPPVERGALLDAVVAALGGVDGIGFALRTDRFATGCAGLDGLDALVCRSTHPARSGEIYYGPRADSVVMRRPFEATTHGTANPDDRAVPLVVLEPGRAPRAVDDEVSTLRVAPTLARLLGVPAPAAATEAPL